MRISFRLTVDSSAQAAGFPINILSRFSWVYRYANSCSTALKADVDLFGGTDDGGPGAALNPAIPLEPMHLEPDGAEPMHLEPRYLEPLYFEPI